MISPPSEENKNSKASEEYKKPSEALYQHLPEIAFHSYLQKYVGMIGFFNFIEHNFNNRHLKSQQELCAQK
jgi:hypothetical protein